MKEESLDIQYEYISRNNEIMTVLERSKSQVVHQMSGAAYCRIELGIDDEEILSAIRIHISIPFP